MNRIQKITFTSLFVVSFPLAATAATPKEIAKVIKLAGDVFVLDTNQRVIASVEQKPNRRQLKEGGSIYEKETLQTKSDGRIKIQFVKDSNEIVLGGNSSLLIQEAGGEKGNVNLELKSGSVRSNVNAKYSSPEGYQVRTANAVAGVRGTQFSVNYDSTKNTTTVATERGAVQLTDPKGQHPVMVVAGKFSELKAANSPTPPKAISENKKLSAELQTSHKEEDSGMKVDDSAKTSSSGDKGEKKSDKAAASTSASPDVALAPEPVKEDTAASTTGTGDTRAPASDTSSSSSSTKLMGTGDTSAAAAAASPSPFTKATNSFDTTKSVVDRVNQQQKQSAQGTATIHVPIK